jgi:hypothetical protein
MLAGPIDLDELDKWMRLVGSVAAGQMFKKHPAERPV